MESKWGGEGSVWVARSAAERRRVEKRSNNTPDVAVPTVGCKQSASQRGEKKKSRALWRKNRLVVP